MTQSKATTNAIRDIKAPVAEGQIGGCKEPRQPSAAGLHDQG
jgi:hypothetical protein